MKRIALFGGTFSPIHNGHVNLARFLQSKFHFDEFRFVPNKAPVLDKNSIIPLADRLAMLALALAPYPEFIIDEREVHRDTPSYTVDTLIDIKREEKNCVISLIIGADSFRQFHRWHEWEKILTLCQLIVLERPGQDESVPKELQEKLHEINDVQSLSKETGVFYRCNAGRYDISSTMVRDLIRLGKDVSAYLPPAVCTYLAEHPINFMSSNH